MSKQVFSERFEVQELIAEGGMGAVYKVLDIKLDRVVALKVVHSHLSSDADFLERFRDEARKTARLQGHPNIVQIFDVANDHGTEYLVMEYFPSTNLRDQLRSQGKFPLQDAVNVTRQIAQALMKSHTCDIIHRDIKPANILLDRHQFVKLTDFGIAKALSDAPLTSTGQLIGTLKYMAPEQARNTALDGKTDLYSLGMVLYELITGKNLWKDVANLAILGKLQAEHTIPPLHFPANIPVGLQTVIGDLLRFDPADRIQSAEDLVARLADLRDIEQDPDATIVQPRIPKPEALEDDKTVAGNPSLSSEYSSQQVKRQFEKPTLLTKTSSSKPKKIAIDGIPSATDPIKSKSTKTIRNALLAAIALLVMSGMYYFSILPSTVDTNVQKKTKIIPKAIPKVRDVRKESQPLTTEEIEVIPINKTQSAASKARAAQSKAEAKRLDAEKQARVAQAEAEAEAKAAEKASKAQAQAETEAQVAEAERVAQAQAAAKDQKAEKARLAQAKVQADARAAEETRLAQAKAAETAMAQEEARKAQEKAAAKVQAAESARLTKANAAAKAQATKEAQIAQAEAAAKAQAAEKAQIAQEKAATQAKAAEKARIAEAKAAAQANAAKEARAAQAQAQAQARAAEKARIAEAKAAAQVKAAEEARAAQALAEAQTQAAEKARAAEAAAVAKVQAADEARAALAADTQALNTLLAELQRSISRKDLQALKSMSSMSTSRQKMLEDLFTRYETIETSIGNVSKSEEKTTIILQFTKFVRPNGEIVQPSRFLKITNVIIPKEKDGWGRLEW